MLPPTSVASAAKRKRATCCGSCDRKPCKHRVLACNLNGHGWFGWHRSRVWVVGEFLVVFFGRENKTRFSGRLVEFWLWRNFGMVFTFVVFFWNGESPIELFLCEMVLFLLGLRGVKKGGEVVSQHGVTVRCRHVLFLKIKLLWF